MPRNGWRSKKFFQRCASPGAPEKTSLPPSQLGPPMAWTMMLSTISRSGPEVTPSAGHGPASTPASTRAAAISMCLKAMDLGPSDGRGSRGLQLLGLLVARQSVAIVLTDRRHQGAHGNPLKGTRRWENFALQASCEPRRELRSRKPDVGLPRKVLGASGSRGYWTALRRGTAGVQIQVMRSLTRMP